jgi:hypothetical protein
MQLILKSFSRMPPRERNLKILNFAMAALPGDGGEYSKLFVF